MDTSTEITIRAPYERIFRLGSEVDRWGERLPHYRYVRVLREKGDTQWLRMSAWRDFIPVTWTARKTTVEGTEDAPGKVVFHHVRGVVRGMDVEWTFTPVGEGEWRVQISHQLADPPMPVRLLGPKLMELIVGKGFIGNIAGKTLRRIKELAESGEEIG
jgi:ribosome-associated toxin RatA of RatAB toxin-antitoxin module